MQFRRFSVLPLLLLLCFVLSTAPGCKDKKPTEADSQNESIQASQVETVPYPDEGVFEQLGPENGLDTQWFLDDPVYVLFARPKRFLESDIGKGNEPMLSGVIQQFMQLPFFPPLMVEKFVQVTALPVETTIETEQNGQKIPQRIGMARRSTLLTLTEPVKVEELIKNALEGPDDSVEARKRKAGEIEYYDLTRKDFATTQRQAVFQIDEKNLVLVEGEEKDIESVFNGKRPQSAALKRLERADIESNDLLWITSLEGIGFDPRILETVLGTIIMQSGVPQGVAGEMVKHLRAMTVSVDVSVEVGKPMLDVRFDAKDAEGAKSIAETFEGLILVGQTSLTAMDEATKASFPLPLDFAEAALNALVVKTEDAKVEISMNKFESFEKIAAEGIHSRQTTMQTMQIRQQRGEQIMMLHRIFMMYYQKYNKFPADIRSTDGTPLLSWRVALLPVIGLEDFHAKFKLDEPWDGPTNKPLLDTMPMIFQSPVPNVRPPKTLVRFFHSEGTPLAKENLKPEDVKFPQSTLMLFTAAPESAVEWTRPDSPEFNIETIESQVGSHLFGITFSGQIVPDLPIIPLSDERSAQQRKFLEALVKDLPMPEMPAPPPPSASEEPVAGPEGEPAAKTE